MRVRTKVTARLFASTTLLLAALLPWLRVPQVVLLIAGGIVAAGLLYALTRLGPNIAVHGAFGTNGFGDRSVLGLNLGGAFLIEVLLTGIFVFVVLSATATWAIPSSAGIAVGFALAAVHLVGLPLDGAGINPARSLGPAVFARGDALSQVWLFIVAPLVGGALAAVVHGLITLAGTEERPPE